ncbi:hypothetical protein CBR_g38066 [Chara braunii]|uniref:Legumain prodomain domain-containing protein n=1 Tax=Chara braunii TaxID=69332 RepID=A0A388K0A4_CHABU|nr:hypothetical protein CBR_g38066 [Chara braunii]|eukprot:GBG63446.1 hypothetical protein CBR_g38066 [Chara braunii]
MLGDQSFGLTNAPPLGLSPSRVPGFSVWNVYTIKAASSLVQVRQLTSCCYGFCYVAAISVAGMSSGFTWPASGHRLGLNWLYNVRVWHYQVRIWHGRGRWCALNRWFRRFPAAAMAGLQADPRAPSVLLPVVCALLLLGLASSACALRDPFGGLRLPSEREREGEVSGEEAEEEDGAMGTRWAILVAGSSGYWNYRHQADVCHAYQVLSRNGLKDENIIVFMYDDIVYHEENPRPGTIINSPNGVNVYKGVPKDYTGGDVRADVFLNVLTGNKEAVKGIGSGKVLSSGPNDHVFIYYSDHGGPGVLGMPGSHFLYADDLNAAIKKMHQAGTFREMVVYLEACESGSIFEGLLRPEWNVYATTASNAYESSWGTYCPYSDSPPPRGYEVCLGDLYSVAWMEDSESRDLSRETLLEQYRVVKNRTANAPGYMLGSHVMQYGKMDIDLEKCSLYLGSDPQLATTAGGKSASTSLSPFDNNQNEEDEGEQTLAGGERRRSSYSINNNKGGGAVAQRDAELVHLWAKFSNSLEGSARKAKAFEELNQITSERAHIDRSVTLIGSLLFGVGGSDQVLNAVRATGLPLVDDWDCLKAAVRVFEANCGQLTTYGMKHMRRFANICNEQVPMPMVEKAAAAACMDYHPPTVHQRVVSAYQIVGMGLDGTGRSSWN